MCQVRNGAARDHGSGPSDLVDLVGHSYGITSDPLTQFACVFSALIHDVDHPGVPNSQLVKEGSKIAAVYKGKSVAEQNSVDIAWNLLYDDNFDQLRQAIYSTESEKERFRQLVVNSVMATDIMDQDLKTLRNARWDKAFHQPYNETAPETAIAECSRAIINRKATIVIEHLIQASDVAHTMQHWHVYRKWNERLFLEMRQAYFNGRSSSVLDPAENWYQGELGFFDYYVIPLAKKLKECGVFGVSSDEYLNYAEENRAEWASRGRRLVMEMKHASDSALSKNQQSGFLSLSPPSSPRCSKMDTLETGTKAYMSLVSPRVGQHIVGGWCYLPLPKDWLILRLESPTVLRTVSRDVYGWWSPPGKRGSKLLMRDNAWAHA